jgi:hypothetical protein
MSVQGGIEETTFSLAAAGLSVSVVCGTAALSHRLCLHYAPFVHRCKSSQLVAHIELDQTFQPAVPGEKDVVFCHQSKRFATPGSEGTIDIKQGQAYLHLSLLQPFADIDYFLRAVFGLLAFDAGGVLFHAAGVVRNGHACLFFGHSGSGKTTVARLSPDALVLNDDLVVLMPSNGGWMVHATPFWNPTQLGRPEATQAPLAAMLRLVQSHQVMLEPMSQAQALAEIVSCVPFVASDLLRSTHLLNLGEALLQAVPVYRLHFVRNSSFWGVVDELVSVQCQSMKP